MKRDYLKIQKTKYLHAFRHTRLCSRASLQFVKHTALCDCIHCNLCLLFILLFLSVKCLVLFRLITHFPSCEHLISPSHFSILYFSTNSPVFQACHGLLLGCRYHIHPFGALFNCILLISSILYLTHPHPSISPLHPVFQPL